jgi:TolB-like protein/Flp pilus assembly protein TadD
MELRPETGFLVGNLLVQPRKGAIRSSQGTHTLSADRMDVLLALAERAGEALSLAELASAAGFDPDTDGGILERHIHAIKVALGDIGPSPRFIVLEADTATLIAPVRAAEEHQVPDDASEEKISFFQQLQRRKVTRVAAGYIVLAWLAIQVADTIMPAVGLPEWAVTLTVALAMIGFPVAIAVAWLFEATPIGMLRDRRREPAALSQRQKIIDVAVMSCLAILVGYFALNVLLDVKQARDEASASIERRIIAAPANTVAVLPFAQLGATGDSSYIGDGIAEEILRIMSRIRELRVTARTASFYFRGKDVDPQTIAQKLQVRHLLTGSVQIVGETVRVSAELVDASTGVLLWSEVFDREMVDVFEIQSEIARAVAKSSRVVLSEDSSERLDYRPTSNLKAYDFYLRGRDYLRQPRTIDVLENAQRLFHRALALDPGYALALAGLCETYLAVYIRTRSTATVDDAQSVCQAALEIDGSLAEVHTALGYLHWHTGDFESAERYFRNAIEINPNFFEAYAGLSDNLFSQKRFDEAGLMLQQLIELQPAYWRGHRKMGSYHYRLGDDAKALPYFQRVVELTPDNAPGWNNLGAVNYMLGNLADAADAWQRAIDIAPTQSMYVNLGTMYYYLGRFEDSIDMQMKAIELAPDDYRIWGRMAAAYVRLDGRGAEANAAYSKGIALATDTLMVNPNEPDANKNVALFYAHAGQRELAVEAIKKALELTPTDPDAYFFAALTYLEIGDEERSLAALEKAVEFGFSKKLIESEWALEPIREEERFKLLLADTKSSNP